MDYHFDAGPADDARRVTHPLWGGELWLEPGTRMSFSQGPREPINIIRTICKGAGGFRRSARAVRRHEQSCHLLTVVDQGSVAHSHSHETFVLDPGFVTIIKNTSAYVAKFLPDEHDSVEVYTLLIPDHLIIPYLPQGVVYGQPLPVTDGHGPGTRALVRLLFEHGQSLPALTLEKLLAALFELVSSLVQTAAAYPPPRLPAGQRHFQSIEKYIEQNITSGDLSLERIARELHVSTRYVSSIFSARGLRFSDYVRRRRLDLARRLLETLDRDTYTIAQIASLSGFGTASRFATVFRAGVGCTPGAYRNASR